MTEHRIKVVRVAAPSHVQFSRRLTDVPVPAGLPEPAAIKEEIFGYWNVLLGRVDPPVRSPYLDLAEVANAYYARALELEALILEAERDPQSGIVRGHPLNRLRTGSLRAFLEAAKHMAQLGSRRLSQEQLLFEMRHDSGM